MSAGACGCTSERCGCCEGTRKLTPLPTDNRPGLDALSYRVGTHGTFLETMKAALSGMVIDAPSADGQTTAHSRPLLGLTTRASDDPAVALLDGWAVVGDVLTFYQERFANEGFMRTATERRSILELARLVGYTPRPGVSATAYLAYTIDEKQAEPVEIPVGARSQTIPGPDELPQAFETSEKLVARSAWNNLQVRLKQPPNITLGNALTIEHIYVAGTATRLKAGDSLLLTFGDDGYPAVMRTVKAAEPQSEAGRTVINLQPLPRLLPTAVGFLQVFIDVITKLPSDPQLSSVISVATGMRDDVYLGLTPDLATWVHDNLGAPVKGTPKPARDAFAVLSQQVEDLLNFDGSDTGPVTKPTDFSHFAAALLKPFRGQARNGLSLSRALNPSFQKGADLPAQLVVQLAPRLQDSFYSAWARATVSSAQSEMKGLYALRLQAPLFGASVSKQPTYAKDDAGGHKPGELLPPEGWMDWSLHGELENTLFLDQAYSDVLAQSFVVVQRGPFVPPEPVAGPIRAVPEQGPEPATRELRQVNAAETVQRTDYGLSGRTTKLKLSDSRRGEKRLSSMAELRSVLVYAQSELLTLTDEPTTPDVVKGAEIPLDRLYNELTSGRWVIFSGERADIPGVTGVRASELLMISGLKQDYDRHLPGDKTRTTLILATTTAYSYKRESLVIYGNVVKATHGETRNETLGAGDASQSLQTVALKQKPLTFVAAPNRAGVDSTLKVYLNDVEWHEVETLAGLGPRDRHFVTRTDDDGTTTVVFGTGRAGARPPTGVENIKASYRSGIGVPGDARAEQISLLQTRPLGVKSVINPLRASGGADRESRDQARTNAPLAVMSLDRLVSVSDYADFTRTFAGIGKALAQRLSDGRKQLVHVTIAGADDIPIDPVSDLYTNLVLALQQLGDPALAIQVDPRELVTLALSAGVRLAPDYQWEPVAAAVRAALLESLGFEARNLGRPVLLSEVVSCMQAVPGVAYVDVDAFGGIPERKANSRTGERELLTPNAISELVKQITKAPRPADRVPVNLAGPDHGRLRPAQLAIFVPAVPDTLILNQIK